MASYPHDSGSDYEDLLSQSEALRLQKELCEEAMDLVNAGIAMQNDPHIGNLEAANAQLSKALQIMEEALEIKYPSEEERHASHRLASKMNRYVKMIQSQREKGVGVGQIHAAQAKMNILDLQNLPKWYHPVEQLLSNSQSLGDIFQSLHRIFGFQEASVLNQKEHLLLLLTNFKEQSDEENSSAVMDGMITERSPHQETELANKGIKRLHDRMFANYVKWCKYVSTKPNFTNDPLVDLVLFFLVWGEAGNFRQVPEYLCFVIHSMLPQAQAKSGEKQPGDFLDQVIRPMYAELQKDNDKKTPQGARASHEEIRNYDDFNEFFWNKKCLKYDPYKVAEAFGEVDKNGRPKTAKKTFVEKRTWRRALLSFRRIFLFNCAMLLAVIGFSLNMVMLCPTTPILYGQDVSNIALSRAFTVLKKEFAAVSPIYDPKAKTNKKFEAQKEKKYKLKKLLSKQAKLRKNDDEETPGPKGTSKDPKCVLPKLAGCLGIEYIEDETFSYIPSDFKALLTQVPFTNCLESSGARCTCYKNLLDKCFEDKLIRIKVANETTGVAPKKVEYYNQKSCILDWQYQARAIIELPGTGTLNCDTCQLDPKYVMSNFGVVMNLINGLLGTYSNNEARKDSGVMMMFAGVGSLGLVLVCELVNFLTSGMGVGYVGRNMSVPFKIYLRYTCFWLILLTIKLIFDYQFMIKTLVETSLFIWYSNKEEYLKYSNFLIQFSFHNIIFILFLWIPAVMVFFYDAQIFYAVQSVIFGSFAGFNLRIGELRSFRVLRLSFKKIPRYFNKKIVPNIDDASGSDTPSGKKKKSKKKGAENEIVTSMPVRHFERVESNGLAPLTIKTQAYTNLLQEGGRSEVQESQDADGANVSHVSAVAGVSGAEFERTISFAMAWNRCLLSLREADVISNRELNVLSYLIDSKDAADRKLYPPVFLTAGKLDESIDIILECAAVYEKLSQDKKKKEKTLQKVEVSMRERLLKDDLRIEAIFGSYKFSTQVLRLLLGDEHKDLNEIFSFIEECVAQQTVLQALNLKSLHVYRTSMSELMKALLDVPRGSEDNNVKFQRSLYKVIDCVEAIVNSLKNIVGKQENLMQILNETPLKPNSFFFPGDSQVYTTKQLMQVVNSEAVLDIVSRAYQLLTVDNFDAEPQSEEGRRRLRFFANSLFMDMPEAKAIRKIRSLTVSTPYYSEIVFYSVNELTAQNDDSIKLLYYLQTIYSHEWTNLLERIGAKDMNEALKKNPEEVQLWASYRGQTLARTVRGMMYNEDAIRFLHWLEIGDNEPMHQKNCPCNRCKRLDEMVALKFNYVCTCQIYGKMRDEQRQQAQDLEYLLKKHRSLRIAYVDGPKKMKEGPPKYFSVLIRAQGNSIAEVYRVELPGNPIVGEGKPENQNHAVIFSRGELIQCIDMNQDGYLEECLKMPNLLSTMDRHKEKNPLTIIGFREYVFTGGVSNLASFMSIQELSFVSLGQRMLAMFHVRQHYGHPDIFDKLFAMGTGGTAKASKGINLSEDIFAGFNTTLRGGRVSHEEFIQVGKGRDVGMQQLALFEAKLSSGAGECVISRDAMRMASRLDFFRLHSWFYGNLGWYFTQTMTVIGVYFFIYGKVYMALSGMDEYFLSRGGIGIGGVLNTSWAFQFGFLLVVPVVAVVGVEQGFRHGITYLIWNCLTLGPLFFTFQMGTRMHYFDRTLIHGGAKYRATGRGFTIKHEKFAELFRFYAFSHFYRGVELLLLLLLFAVYGTFSWCNCSWTIDIEYYGGVPPSDIEWKGRCYANYYQKCVLPTKQNYGLMSFSLWIIAVTWMWAPFLFNPSGLDWDKLMEDYNDWQNWLRTTNDSSQSWSGWWSTELEYLEHSTWFSRMVSLVRKTRFFFLAYWIYLQMAYNAYFRSRDLVIEKDNAMMAYILAGIMFVVILLFLGCGYLATRVKKKMTFKQRKLRKIKFLMTCCGMLFGILSLTVLSLNNLVEIVIILGIAAYWFLQVCIYRLKFNHVAVRAMARGYDRMIGWVIFGPILFVAMFLPFLSAFQQRVMFNNAFTSGLEVSKLFAHDAAAASKVVKVRRVAKKKKRDD